MNTLTPEQLQKELDARLPACMGLERMWCSVIPGFYTVPSANESNVLQERQKDAVSLGGLC
jgi:hypothetical protein